MRGVHKEIVYNLPTELKIKDNPELQPRFAKATYHLEHSNWLSNLFIKDDQM